MMIGRVTQCTRTLVVRTFHKPRSIIQFAINSIEDRGLICLFLFLFNSGNRLKRNIPLVSGPTIITPPITRCSPGSSQTYNSSIDTPLFTPRADLRGTTLVGLHHGSQWRAKCLENNEAFSIADFPLSIVGTNKV